MSEKREARAIRVLIAKPGLDGHDVGAKIVCRALMDAGMHVVYTGLRQTPEQIAAAAASEDVDVIGLSVMSGAHLPLCRKVAAELASRDLRGKLWIVGGVVPPGDEVALREIGVDGVFPIGTPLEEIVEFIRGKVTL